MRLHVIGSGCPQPTPEWFGSAFVLETRSEMILVDCGPGTTHKLARMGIKATRINHVFLTHHHFDHNVDVPCFALVRWDLSTGGEPPLRVYGPPPTESFVAKLLGPEGVFYDDWKARIEHPASHECHRMRGGTLPRPAPRVEPLDLVSGSIVETESCRVTASRVHHVEPWLQSLVYRFDTDEGSVLFAGDCGDCSELRDAARGVDTLVMACTHFGREHMSADLVDVITGTPEAAEVGNDAGVQRLILTHVSPNFSRPGLRERAVAEIARNYPGAIVFPSELTTVELSDLGSRTPL